jgi:outer membrane protein OmpA-like peptidoglycan-associated protein
MRPAPPSRLPPRPSLLLAATAALLTASSASPGFAQTACADSVARAADDVQRGAGLSSPALRDVQSFCGGGGAARIVDTLVARGACDQAAQLARTLPGYEGMAPAQYAADACLGEQVRSGLDDLEVAVGGSESDKEGWSAEREESKAEARGPYPSTPPASQPGGGLPRGSDGLAGAGAGSGGGGRGAWGSTEAQSRSAEPSGKRRASNAATGIGDYLPETASSVPQGERIALADRPALESRSRGGPGAATSAGAYALSSRDPVAWSRLSFSIWFDFDSAALRPEALSTIATLARNISSMDGVTVLEVVGHTDSTGYWDYNQDLSVRRAESVRQALVLAGVPWERLAISGRGEDEPVAGNGSDWGRAQNRRVEFRFYKPLASRAVTR